MRISCGGTGEFPVTIDLHQGSTLSAYLLTPIIDELTAHILEEVLWFMFVDDIVLVDESRDRVNAKLERWWEALKSKGFKISTKTIYMDCNFRAETIVRIEAPEIPQINSF